MSVQSSISFQGKHLGDILLLKQAFPRIDEMFQEFKTPEFKRLTEKQKSDKVYHLLFQEIERTRTPAFFLGSVIDYIDRVNLEKVLEHCTFSSFELWLNQFSELSFEENYWVRAHIVGKWVPREEYQVLFPIGMGKTYAGSHFVTAHQSPDLDTTVASFWGWVDAFGARVSEGLHVWNLPGGPNQAQMEIALLFEQIFGGGIFHHVSKTRSTLSVSSLDLISQKGVLKTQTEESTLEIDHHRNQNAILLVDERGYYIGDWRSFDVEGVRNVIMLFNQCLRWFESHLHLELISLFSKETLSLKEIPPFVRSLTQMQIQQCEPVKEFTEKQKQHVQDYLKNVLGVKDGIGSTFESFAVAMKERSLFEFHQFIELIEALPKSPLFDQSGFLLENRPRIFHQLEKIILGLSKAIRSVRTYVERLGIALSIKTEVFGYLPQSVSYRADVEEIRSKIDSYSYLTVTYSDQEGGLNPLGIIHAGDLHRPVLGTVSLRDFCNREETKIPSYLEVISVIDHHKSVLSTFSPPMALISDAQSSNVLVAELAYVINDKYSTGGLSLEEIEAQIKTLERDLSSVQNKRLMQRLLQRHMAATQKGEFFIAPLREFVEYLHFFYAILDDTDLLTKVSHRDVECVASLLNRLKSLMLKTEVEIIAFDDLPKDGTFVQRAAQRILQHPDTYSLYRKIYLAKESSVEHNFALCIEGKPSSVFADTKEQNGCCRVGQTKMFARNVAAFEKHAPLLRRRWYEDSVRGYSQKSEIDLHLHMITTVAGAEDLFAGTKGAYSHKDELWIWIPETEQAIERLKSFLSAFAAIPQVIDNQMEVQFLGKNAKELDKIFEESFMSIPRKAAASKEEALPIAVLRFNAGSINSRKAMISPCLPRLVY